jgi:Ca2+-binding EF-hand superfamily protein
MTKFTRLKSRKSSSGYPWRRITSSKYVASFIIFPSSIYGRQVKELFDLFDTDKDHALNLNELAALLEDIGSKITALPAVCVLL